MGRVKGNGGHPVDAMGRVKGNDDHPVVAMGRVKGNDDHPVDAMGRVKPVAWEGNAAVNGSRRAKGIGK
jgi:hypothetical protein